MIETHAHIYDEQFEDDFELMLENAKNAGVSEVWMPNCDHETIPKMLGLETRFPNFAKPMIGLHPVYVKENFEAELAIVGNWLSKRDFIMIGEIGLDFYWDTTFTAQQEAAFLIQLGFAKQYNLPICIHSRNSFSRTCELIEQFAWPDLKGIFHCFGGSVEDAQRAIDLNFLLGIGGTVTFKNAGVDKIVQAVDLKHIVLETDAPYLAPTPHRGKRNEPAFLSIIAQKIADCQQISIQKVIEITTFNANKLIKKNA